MRLASWALIRSREPLEVKRRVGYLPDAVGFYGRLSGRENLEYTARLNGLLSRGVAARIDELLAQVGLVDAPTARPTRTRAACCSASG